MINESITTIYLSQAPVSVFVPAHEEGETLPVIYMTYGQSLFDDNEQGWHTREAVRAERECSGKAAIIVGVHTKIDGSTTPQNICSDSQRAFDDFLMNTIMPTVERQFPVKSGRENTALCGSSSGGVQCLYTALSHPEAFGAAGVFSPTLTQYDFDELTGWFFQTVTDEPPYLYLYTGAGDETEQEIFQYVEQTYDMLMACYPPHLLNEVVLPEEKHNEAAWSMIFKDFLHTFLSLREIMDN